MTADSSVANADEAPVVLDSGLTALRSSIVSSSGTLACTYGSNYRGANVLTVWAVETRETELRRETGASLVAARFTPDETELIVATRDGDTGKLFQTPSRNSSETDKVLFEMPDVAGIAISRDSRIAVLRRRSSGLIILDTATGASVGLGEGTHFRRVVVSADGELAVASATGRTEIFAVADHAVLGVVESGPITSMDCSAGIVVTASGQSLSVAWGGGALGEVYVAPEPIRRIAMSTGGTAAAVAYESGFTIVNVITGDVLIQQETYSPVTRLTFRLDDKVLITSHDDNRARLWDLPKLPSRSHDHLNWQADAPAHDDLLHRRPLAAALATRLRRFQEEDASPSFLLHIDGPWGSGKSTLLYLLKEELELGPAPWLPIEFNAWQQSKVGTSWWALLATLRRDMVRDRSLPRRIWLRVVETWARFHRAGAPFILACLALVALAAGFFFLLRPDKLTFRSSADIAEGISALIVPLGTLWAGSKVAARYFLWDSAQGARLYEQSSTNPMIDVSRHFGWLVAKAGKPVVFMIDDLDRCTDSYVVDLLETVQTLIRDPVGSAKPPSFVIAADGAWIRRSFEAAYSQFDTSVASPGLPLGYLFLDKLFQLRVRVPKVDAVRKDSYLRHLLGTSAAAIQPSIASQESALSQLRRSSSEADVVAVLRETSPEIRDMIADAAVERLSSPPFITRTEHWLQQFAPLLPPNPRAMKRFINDYSILRAVRTLEGNAVDMAPLALWAVIETRWPSLADYLGVHPEAIGLVQRAGAAPGAHPAVDEIPADLLCLFTAPELRRLVFFDPGGPLTAELVAQCYGTEESP